VSVVHISILEAQLQNGRLYIVRDGRVYNVQGIEVK
jgi:hypothetical protein